MRVFRVSCARVAASALALLAVSHFTCDAAVTPNVNISATPLVVPIEIPTAITVYDPAGRFISNGSSSICCVHSLDNTFVAYRYGKRCHNTSVVAPQHWQSSVLSVLP